MSWPARSPGLGAGHLLPSPRREPMHDRERSAGRVRSGRAALDELALKDAVVGVVHDQLAG
jgi:hypothetical protein